MIIPAPKTEPVSKKTVILGATPNPTRYAYRAAHSLVAKGHPIVNVGIKEGEVAGEPILNGRPEVEEVDTVTLYVGPRHQPQYYDWLIETQPRRIIFNPGTENSELEQLAEDHGIETERACTLVLLGTGGY